MARDKNFLIIYHLPHNSTRSLLLRDNWRTGEKLALSKRVRKCNDKAHGASVRSQALIQLAFLHTDFARTLWGRTDCEIPILKLAC